ncbi:MAG: hypothetical protein HYZ45_09920 [Burkholderiales bacterium]|nr:hypothetical protein [Burkholderiales bacterium]
MPAKKTSKPKAPKVRRFTQVGINRGIGHPYSTLHSQYTGYHSANIERRVARAVTAEQRTSQFLTHFSSVLKTWYSSLANCSEIEVQIALVNDEYFFISSNKNGTAEYFYDKLASDEALKFGVIPLAQAAISSARKSVANEAFRNERHARKFTSAIGGRREVEAARNIADYAASGRDMCLKIDACADVGAQVGQFLSGALAGKKVMIVTSAYEMHAEQKILLALCKAARQFDGDANIVFAGTFRPCRGCFESLSVVKRFYLPNVQFGSRPGHFWQTTTRAHAEIIKHLVDHGFLTAAHNGLFDKDGCLIGLTETTYRPDLRLRDGTRTADLHFASDSESDASDSESDSESD